MELNRITEKDQVGEKLYGLLDDHLEGVGFLMGIALKAIDMGVFPDDKDRFIEEIEVMEKRNIEIRNEIGWKE